VKEIREMIHTIEVHANSGEEAMQMAAVLLDEWTGASPDNMTAYPSPEKVDTDPRGIWCVEYSDQDPGMGGVQHRGHDVHSDGYCMTCLRWTQGHRPQR
jgi:hypothetical protein